MHSKKIPQTQTGPRANPCEGEEGVSRQAGLPAGKKTRPGARAGRGVAGIHLCVTQEQFRVAHLEIHHPVSRDAVLAPLRDSTSRQAAYFCDLAGAAERINDATGQFGFACVIHAAHLSSLRGILQARSDAIYLEF